MIAEYTSIRSYIVSAINTAWTSCPVVVGQNDSQRTGQFAMVQLIGDQSIDWATPNRDHVTFSFQIAGRFTLASAANPELEAVTKASALRTQLLADKNAGGSGFNPMVGSFNVEAVDPQDNYYDVVLQFSVSAVAVR